MNSNKEDAHGNSQTAVDDGVNNLVHFVIGLECVVYLSMSSVGCCLPEDMQFTACFVC